MRKCRLFFCKTGKEKYLSHLDLMRVFRRLFNRAELPLKHSEGYNPHPLLSIALPLPLGQESLCEALDVTFQGELGSFLTLPDRLNPFLPDGILITRAAVPLYKPADLTLVRAELYAPQGWGALPDEVVINKTTKSGNERSIRISRDSYRLADDATLVCMTPPDFNPRQISDALGITYCEVKRVAVYDASGREFQ